MTDTPQRLTRRLRELARIAYEEELRRALVPLAAAFDAWRTGTITGTDLKEQIHAFHEGPARELFLKYDRRSVRLAVAHAIVSGIIDRARVPAELLEHLKGAIEFYERPTD